jgi:hypothetical protein
MPAKTFHKRTLKPATRAHTHREPKKTTSQTSKSPKNTRSHTIKPGTKFCSNLHRLAAICWTRLIKYSVLLTDRKSVAAAAEPAEHYGADTTCLQARIVLKEIG